MNDKDLKIKINEIMLRLKREAISYEYIQVVPIYKIENTLNRILLDINPKEVKHERKPKTDTERIIPRIGN
jgi:hypothetical protein